MINNPDTSLVCFKAISNFTSELGDMFAKKQRSLKLYCRIINKTTISHGKAISKHTDAFRQFCIQNRDAIINKNSAKLTTNRISYSQRVFIDMKDIFKLADKDTTEVIWAHLLCISAIVDPAGKAKEVLKQNLKDGKTGSEETNFLTNIIDKVEEHVDPTANPMEAVSSIMQSGIFTDLIGGMNKGFNDGSLDLGKLMGAVQGMVGKLSDGGEGGSQDASGAMNMITSMMGNLGNLGNGAGAGGDSKNVPDIAQMMQGLMKPPENKQKEK
jgi:hypothetical protein